MFIVGPIGELHTFLLGGISRSDRPLMPLFIGHGSVRTSLQMLSVDSSYRIHGFQKHWLLLMMMACKHRGARKKGVSTLYKKSFTNLVGIFKKISTVPCLRSRYANALTFLRVRGARCAGRA